MSRKRGRQRGKNKKHMMSKKGGGQLCKNNKNVPATPKLRDNSRVYFTTEGAQYMALDVGGGGLCALLGVIAVAMDAAGTPCEEIFAAVSGELTDDMKGYVQSLRANIVSTCGDQFAFKDGEELASFDDIVHDPMWVIVTRAMWELVTLHPTGYLDGRAVWLLAKFLGLHGFRIVKHEDGHLVPCDAGGPISSEECPMMLHDGYGHFKVLIPLRRMPLEFEMEEEYHLLLDEGFVDGTDEEEAVPGTSDSETSDGTDEVPESAVAVDVAGTEASDGGSTPSPESSDSGGGDSDRGARGAFGENAEGEQVKAATRVSSKRSHPWDDNEYWDDDANYYSGCTIVGEDGWTLVGKEGRRMGLETTLAFDEASGLYDLTSPNKCQPLFLDHDDETGKNEAAEVDEAVDEVGEDEAAEEVDEDEEAEAEAGEEVQQTIVVHEGTTISPWMLAFFLPLLLAVGAALFLVFQAAVTSTTVLLRIGEAFASVSNNGSNSANNNKCSSRRRRAARRLKTGRTGIGRILKCRFAGGRRFRPAGSRRNGRSFWARGQRMSEGELLVMDDDSARIFGMVLAFLRGGAKSGDQQQTQGRPKRDRRPAGGVFAPGWAPDPAPNARNDSARESEEDGEDGEDSGDADDAASLDGVSDGEESEEDEEDSDEDSGKGPRGAGGGAGGVASAGDENSDLEDSGYAPSEAGDTDGDTDDDTTSDECSSTGGETRCEGCEEDFYCELVECPTCNAQYCQDCENDLSSDKERTCSRCQRADDDGVGDFSTGGVTDGPDEYTNTESGTVSGNSKRRRRSAGKKHNRIPRTSSPRELLMVPRDDQQAELMLSLYHKAREMERKLAGENKRIKEVRNLTLLDLTEAASCLAKGSPVREEIWRKCEKENYALYGITVRRAGPTGETIPGTKVTSDKGRRGEVVEAKMDEGYTVFTVEWSEGKSNRRSAYSTEDVLRTRDDNQGVATLEEAKEKMGVFLLATLCMVNVQVYRFITKNTKLETVSVSSETRPLARDKKVDVIKGRNHAWDETKKARAVDMLMDNEVTFLDSSEDKGLRVEMEESSCFEMMGLINDARAHFTGLVRSTEDFQDKHLAFVNHFVRGAQASFRLGRPTNMASSMIHLSVNELPPGVQAKTLKEQDTQLYQPGEPTSFSLGMRCVLARARVKDSEEFGDGGSSTCQFLMRYPLYRLLDLSRSDNLPLCPTTEHSNHVSPTLRHRDAYSQAFSSHSKRKADLDVFDIIKGGYHSVSQEKRSEKGVIENENERIAFGAKFNKGRTHLVGSDECLLGFLLLEELVSRNGIDSFMEKLPNKDDIVKMCNKVLEMNPRKRENEDHLCPPKFKQRIEAIVDELVEGNKVTRSDISLLSCSLTVLDSLLTAALRKQDILGQLAKDLYRMKCKDVHGNDIAITRCLLPRYFKNKKALENSTCGVVVNHTKHEKCEGAYAVMAVIGRKVMRRLLEKEAEKDLAELRKKGGCTERDFERVAESYSLTPHLGPFDDKGRVFTPSQMTGMYKWLGQRTMGLSHFGTHIIRSNHATAVAMYCVRTGLSHDDQAVKDLFALARHGDKQRIRFYTKVKGDTPNSCDFLTNLSGALPSLRRLGEGGGVKTSEKKVASLNDIEVGLSGLFAFEDAEFDKSGALARGKPVMGDGAYRKLDVVEMDDEEKDLVRQERKATRKANIATEEKREKEAKTARYENKVDTGAKSGGRKKGGVRADKLEYRKSAFARINQLVLNASKLKRLEKGKKPKRMTLEYSLKNDQKTVRVAFHDDVKRFLHSANPGEKDFLDGFYLDLIDGKSRPGSKADAYAREHRIEWSYHDWPTGNVCVSVPREKKGGKKRKLVEEGEGS